MPNRRWTVLALAATLLCGNVLTSSAAAPATASAFVPITPCRLVDTRPGTDNVGTRSTPLAAGETFTAAVTGSNGNCTIPATATGVSLNVTVITPTAASFLTVFPADAPLPVTASLNWVAGQAPTPNAVTSALSSGGAVSFYNLSGTVHLAADAVGYYEPVAAGTPGPPGAPAPRPARIVWVATSGGDHTSLAAALASITDAGPTRRYLIRIAPGIYVEPGGIDLKAYVDVQGSGEALTTISCTCGSPTTPITNGSSATMRALGDAMDTRVSDLTVVNGSTATYTTGIWTSRATTGSNQPAWSVTFAHVTAYASGGTGNYAIWNQGGNPILSFVTAEATGFGSEAFAIANELGSPHLDHVTATASGAATNARGILNYQVRGGTIADSTIRSTGTVSAAIENVASSIVVDRSDLLATGTTLHDGIRQSSLSFVTLRGSVVATSGTGTGFSIDNVNVGDGARVANSVIDGVNGTNFACNAVTDGFAFTALDTHCT